MNRKELKEIFIDIANKNEDYEDMISKIRSLQSNGDITEKQYDYLLKNWDKLLKKYNLD